MGVSIGEGGQALSTVCWLSCFPETVEGGREGAAFVEQELKWRGIWNEAGV